MVRQNNKTADELARYWTRIGARFTVLPASRYLDPEKLIAATANLVPQDYRLFFSAATWVGTHYELLNSRRLRNELLQLENRSSAIAGALLTVALELTPEASLLQSATEHCRPLQKPEPLFEQHAGSSVLLEKVKSGCLPCFSRWGLWHDEVTFKRGAIRPIQWIRRNCPELRIRELLGANLEADIMQEVGVLELTVSELSRILGTTYAATHDAVSRLVRRGLLEKGKEGNKRPLSVPGDLAEWFACYPVPAEPALRIYEKGSARYSGALERLAGMDSE